jgi:purine-binding chemotaxis protein CheW
MLTFRVDGQSFALTTAMVREVARMPRVTRVPNSPAALLGLANLRGAVIPVLSMAHLLQLTPRTTTRIIVIDAGEPVGLAVDDAMQASASPEASPAKVLDAATLVARNMPAKVDRRSGGGGAGVISSVEAMKPVETFALVVFAIGNQEFGMPLKVVEEVLRLPQDITALPDADEVVVGSTAVRGAVLPLLSLRALLALPGTGGSPGTRVLVVKIGAHRIGLLVDEMRSILQVPETSVDALPQVLSRGGAEARIQAICRLNDGERLVSVLAAEHLVREDITARLLQGASGEQVEMAQDANNADAETEQFLLFRIGTQDFGLPIGAVEEVAQLPSSLTLLPKAPAFVLGVMNLRGQVVPVIDQARRFGAGAPASGRRRVIVTRLGDLQAGFLVDGVSEVVRVEAAALRTAPDFGSDETRVFDRVANLDEGQRIVLIVSPRELLDRAEQDLLRALGSKGAKAAR